MGAHRIVTLVENPRRSIVTLVGAAVVVDVVASSRAGASSREAMVATTTSSGSGAVLLALGGAVLVLGIVGFVVFTYTRRKRKPGQCDAQREALELAERSVKYWEAARSHLETVERERTMVDRTANGESHASLVAKAANGLKAAMIQRDECQLELIRCMASGVPAVPVIPAQAPVQPFFTPGTESPPSTGPDPG
jgi:hypothetical protein